jgi:methyl-accepting chemotaxis protein
MPDDTKLINLYGSTNMTPPRSPVPGGSGAANEALATVFLASLVSDLALVKVQIAEINRALACRAELDRDIAASFEAIRGHLRDQVEHNGNVRESILAQGPVNDELGKLIEKHNRFVADITTVIEELDARLNALDGKHSVEVTPASTLSANLDEPVIA